MSIEAYHRLEWEPGWKYEYWDGCAHITPRELSMACVRPVTRKPKAPLSPPMTPVQPSDAEALLPPFLAAFEDSIEYCDWPRERIIESAREAIDGYFRGRHGPPLAASRIVRGGTSGNALLGACLVVQSGERRALLDLLFVVPGQQRRGLATAMAASTLSALHQTGFETLEGRYFPGNRASRSWHHGFGFQDRPDWLNAGHLLAHARHALERQRLLGTDDPQLITRLSAAVDHWQTEVSRLEALRDRD